MIEFENLGELNATFVDDYKAAFNEVLNNGWYILGNKLQGFEEEFSSYCGVPHCAGVANGLEALSISLRACNLQKGSEVIVPSNTYIATILSILHNDMVPVLVEPDIATYNINPGKIEARITANTKAIMVVHLYGKMCQMDKIVALAQKYNLRIIEDCAQAHGAKFKDKTAGTFGDFGAYSFYPTKNLGALGDAGAIVTNSDDLYEQVKMLRNYGSETKYYNNVVGFNSRLDEVQAAFLSVKLKKLDLINEHKRILAKLYQENLKSDFIKPVIDPDYLDVFHIYNIRHPKRDELKSYLLKNNIKTEIHYPIPPHKQKALKGMFKANFPISEEIHQTTLSLPISFMHSQDDIGVVIEALNNF